MKRIPLIIIDLLMTTSLLVACILGLPNLEVFMIIDYSMLTLTGILITLYGAVFIINYDNGEIEQEDAEKFFSILKDEPHFIWDVVHLLLITVNTCLFLLTEHTTLAMFYWFTVLGIIKLRKSCRKRYWEFKNVQN